VQPNTKEKLNENRLASFTKGLKSLSYYNWITNNLSFIVYIVFLSVIYIALRNHNEKMVRNINKLGKQNKELSYELKTLNGNLLFQSKQSKLKEVVATMGLEVPVNAPIMLTDSTLITVK
jgi:cell division protein FtsL